MFGRRGSAIKFVSKWCNNNFLNLNVNKTKELVIDFRRKKNEKNPITINGSNVNIVQEYKYLGCIINDDLSWDSHIANQIKKQTKDSIMLDA